MIIALLVGLCAIALYLIVRYWTTITIFMEPFFEWLRQNLLLGIVCYMLIYICFVVLVIPGTILTLGGAFTFGNLFPGLKGFLLALTLVVVSATIGAMLAFLIGRFLIRDFLKRNVISRINLFEAIDRGLGNNGFKLVFLLRMTPIVPYNVFNYGMSVTTVSFRDFTFGSVGMIPMSSLYVYVGANIDTFSQIITG
mmetsp:Transcript_31855/g.23575  ORF Transcript_31855/g.23575 Transcript_31855/m.23575 type:complete len:196 (+) Transcript_31855:113-700(+)